MCSTANTQPQLPLIPINIDIGLVHLSYSLRILGSSQNSVLSAPYPLQSLLNTWKKLPRRQHREPCRCEKPNPVSHSVRWTPPAVKAIRVCANPDLSLLTSGRNPDSGCRITAAVSRPRHPFGRGFAGRGGSGETKPVTVTNFALRKYVSMVREEIR
jgi:hypothetical protein